jgi:hypothetical protein
MIDHLHEAITLIKTKSASQFEIAVKSQTGLGNVVRLISVLFKFLHQSIPHFLESPLGKFHQFEFSDCISAKKTQI